MIALVNLLNLVAIVLSILARSVSTLLRAMAAFSVASSVTPLIGLVYIPLLTLAIVFCNTVRGSTGASGTALGRCLIFLALYLPEPTFSNTAKPSLKRERSTSSKVSLDRLLPVFKNRSPSSLKSLCASRIIFCISA